MLADPLSRTVRSAEWLHRGQSGDARSHCAPQAQGCSAGRFHHGGDGGSHACSGGGEGGGGLLIVEARYGDLSVSEEDAAARATAPYIDVAVPLQYLVSESNLIVAGGPSRSWLEGFYDPSLGSAPEQNRLRIRYKFYNMMHSVEYDDEESIAIPMEHHCIQQQMDAQEAAEAQAAQAEAEAQQTASTRGRPTLAIAGGGAARSAASTSAGAAAPRASSLSSASSRAAALARKKARRRLLLYSSLALAGASLYVLHSRPAALAHARMAVHSWAQALQRLLAHVRGGTPAAAPAASSSWQQQQLAQQAPLQPQPTLKPVAASAVASA